MMTTEHTNKALGFILAVGVMVGVASATPPCGEWTQHIGPNADGTHNLLRGVKAFSSTNAWAVGDYQGTRQGSMELYGVIVHWDGDQWEIVPSPNPGKSFAGGTWVSLWDVDGAAPDDVWAVGHHEHPSDPGTETLTLHWNGSEWDVVPSPRTGPLSSGSTFWAVEAIESDDVWAVGAWANENDAARRSPLAAHWDGSDWTIFELPLATPTGDQELRDVDAVSTDSVWAVGGWGVTETAPYVLRFDGSSWHMVNPQPDISQYQSLEEVEAFADNDVWVSASRTGAGGPVMLHWDGSTWTAFDPAGGGQAIAGVAPDDIWSISAYALSHWDGSSWTQAASWESNLQDARVFGSLDAASTCGVFAAGLRWLGDTDEYSTLQGYFVATACPSDFNQDGVVNAADVGAFLNAYFADLANGTALTDLDGSGVVNAADVGAFLTAYFSDLPNCS